MGGKIEYFLQDLFEIKLMMRWKRASNSGTKYEQRDEPFDAKSPEFLAYEVGCNEKKMLILQHCQFDVFSQINNNKKYILERLNGVVRYFVSVHFE